jgi:hypothetical protein
LLDNSIVAGDYTVLLPPGTESVTVQSLILAPSSPSVITLELPAASTAVPAFTATGPGYGLFINSGAVFINSSGAASGSPIAISDSIRINNGGRYIHHTRRSHSANIMVLSAAPGTEAGIFEFNIPAASSTISISGRVFGRLVLSSAAAGGTVNYTGAGTRGLRIRSDLEIGNGVNFSLNLGDTLAIGNNLIQQGGVFNLGTTDRTLVLAVAGNIIQQSGALITETGTAFPELLLNGREKQFATLQGALNNDVGFVMHNPAGVDLLDNLSLPYLLDLENGILNTNSFLLTLQSNCTVSADSTTSRSFVNGRLRKEGLVAADRFLFPVGKDNLQRWLELKKVTGNYTVTFYRENPRLVSAILGPGLDHISAIEYWTVTPDASPAHSGAVELSFDDANSGGVTQLSYLRVAQLTGNNWSNAGRVLTTGIVAMGSVLSKEMFFNSAGATEYFTLASSDAAQNPLPVRLLSFAAGKDPGGIRLSWQVETGFLPEAFLVEASGNGLSFATIQAVPAQAGIAVYTYMDKRNEPGTRFYRLRWIDKGGTAGSSGTVMIRAYAALPAGELRLFPVPVKNSAMLLVQSGRSSRVSIIVCDVQGKTVYTLSRDLFAGVNQVALDLSPLRTGVYYLSLSGGETRGFIRLVKE